MLNKQKGNMYKFVTHTWNVVKGKCPHDCSYCYMKRFPQGKLRLDEKELKVNLGNSNYIFVGSSTDMFANDVPDEWIDRILYKCREFPQNTYLFQSKNPQRFINFMNMFPEHSILGTTMETDRDTNKISKCPTPFERALVMKAIHNLGMQTMISIEPVMDFDVSLFANLIKEISPEFISIGADSKNSKLEEPSKAKLESLIAILKDGGIKVILKDNLKRLYAISVLNELEGGKHES